MATFTSISNTGAATGAGNWADGASWLKATETSVTVTVLVVGGTVTFTRSAGNWTTNCGIGTNVTFSGFANAGNNNVAFVATNVTTLVLTAATGTAVSEGPTGSITAKESFISPGVRGTDYPGGSAAGDTVNIGTTPGQTHVITYNAVPTSLTGLSLTVAVGSGNVTYTGSSGWMGSIAVGDWIEFSGFADYRNNQSCQVTVLSTTVLTAVQAVNSQVAEGPTSNVSAIWGSITGKITINATTGAGASRLQFPTNSSVALCTNHNDILINQLGELRVGSSGAGIITKAYTPKLIWNTTADNTYGINIVATGKFTTYGDPDFYGSVPSSTLYSDYTSTAQGSTAQTIYVTDNVSSKWAIGQELMVHFNRAYGASSTDTNKAFFLFTITSAPTWDGTKSTVVGTVTNYTGTVGTQFATGGIVVNASRNVKFYKLGYSRSIGDNNSVSPVRPKVTDANTSAGNTNMSNVQFSSWYAVAQAYSISTQVIIRNGYAAVYNVSGLTFSGAIYAMNQGIGLGQGTTCSSDTLIFNTSTAIASGTGNIFNGKMYATTYGAGDSFGTHNGSYFSNAIAFTGNYQTLTVPSCTYWNADAVDAEGTLILGSLGYDSLGNSKPNTIDVAIATTYANTRSNGGYLSYNAKVVNTGLLYGTYRNRNFYKGRIGNENYLQVANSHYIGDSFGDIWKRPSDGTSDYPSLRTGGSANVCDVTPLSLCSAVNYLSILRVNVWATASIAKTYRFYLQTTYATLAKTSLVLYAEYTDGSGNKAYTNSSGAGNFTTRANQADWSQYLELSVNPGQDCFVTLYILLQSYESTKKVWIDPQVKSCLTTTNFYLQPLKYTPAWIYGDVNLSLTADSQLWDITVSDPAVVGAYTGISINYSTQTVTLSASHTIQELYDYAQYDLCQTANYGYTQWFKTLDGINFTSIYNIVLNTGVALTGGGTINVGALSFTKTGSATYDGIIITSTNRVVHVQLIGTVSGSSYYIAKVSDGTVLISGTASGDTNDLYTYAADVPVVVKVRKSDYIPVSYNGTITSAGLSLNVSQAVDTIHA